MFFAIGLHLAFGAIWDRQILQTEDLILNSLETGSECVRNAGLYVNPPKNPFCLGQ